MEFAAIPTEYAGVRFRSRLEARWACTFDQLGWEWEYEPFDLPGWIPDFLVDIHDGHRPFLIDVKPAKGPKCPRDIQIKIEQALGAPPPIELRIAGAPPRPTQVWAEWEKALPYRLAVLGSKLITLPPGVFDAWCGIGWVYDTTCGWFGGFEYVNGPTLRAAWLKAGNTVQWKAPR